MFKHRSREQESMDDFSLANDELRKNLDELELLNQWFGSRHTLINALDKVLKRYPDKFKQDGIVIADLGCGSGDLTLSISEWAKNRNIPVKIMGIDANPFMVDYAAKKSKLNDAVEYKVIDIFSPEISQMQFDIVALSSVCHHFEDDTLVDLFKQLHRQTRLAIIVNDLQRYWFSYYGVKWLTKILNFSSLAKKDGPLSVLRGFSRKDLMSLLKSAGLAKYEIRWSLAFRWQVIIWS
jgi:SAM-dependent methyltransferase